MTLRRTDPAPGLRRRVVAAVGPTRTWHRIGRGYTAALRYVVRPVAGRPVFVKAAADELTADWLRLEHALLTAAPATFMPAVVAWDGDDPPILVIEDLSAAAWPPPWDAERVARVLATLDRVHAHPHGTELPRLEDEAGELNGWAVVAEDPAPFLSLGLAAGCWLSAVLPDLVEAARAAPLAGQALLHADVRSDNIALLADRTVLVDWDRCLVGNPAFDAALWAPSLHSEGGPRPEAVAGDQPELAALVAGFFAARAGLPPPHPTSTVRALQLAQLRVALPWACRVLGLPAPAGTRTGRVP